MSPNAPVPPKATSGVPALDVSFENEEGDEQSRKQFAMEIYERYLRDESEHQVVLDPPVMATFLEKYETMLEGVED